MSRLRAGVGLTLIAIVATSVGCAAAKPAGTDYHTKRPPLRREGLAVGVSVGGAGFTGTGELASTGSAGGRAGLRLATTATRKLLFSWQIDSFGAVRTVTEGAEQKTVLDNYTAATVGGQYYIRTRWWLKVGLGGALFRRGSADERVQGQVAGGVLMTGVGYDLTRLGQLVFSVELTALNSRHGDAGTVNAGGLGLSATLY